MTFDTTFTPGFDRGEPQDADMPDGMTAKRGQGDLEEDFRMITNGFGHMHKSVPDPLVEADPGQDFQDIERDAQEEARNVERGFDDLDFSGVDVGGDL